MKKQYRNVIKTKKALRNALIELIEEKKDIENITVNELVTKADIAKSTFYSHYDDIYDLVQELQDEIISNLNVIISDLNLESASFEKAFDLVLKYLKENEEMFSKVIMASTPVFFIEKLKHILVKQVFNRVSYGILKENINIRDAQIRFFANGAVDLVVDYFKGRLNITLDELKILVSNLVLENLK